MLYGEGNKFELSSRESEGRQASVVIRTLHKNESRPFRHTSPSPQLFNCLHLFFHKLIHIHQHQCNRCHKSIGRLSHPVISKVDVNGEGMSLTLAPNGSSSNSPPPLLRCCRPRSESVCWKSAARKMSSPMERNQTQDEPHA